jgi:Domain of unknown function (DUF222)/HNH endonuclease
VTELIDGAVAADVTGAATERLEAEACTLAAQLAAATCRFLALVGELERREAWRSWGCRSMAHWLSWKCGIGLHAARQQVRVAAALAGLPRVTAAFARGELSYSKVRALARVATAESEEELVDFARVATAAQLERTVGAYEGVVRRANPAEEANPPESGLRVRYHDDGTATLTMPVDIAVALLDAVDAARRELADVSAETTRAGALEHVVRCYRQPDAHAAPRTELVVHTDVDLVAAATRPDAVVLTFDAVRRLSCDANLRRVVDGPDGTVADVGRRQPTIPRRLRRVLMRRDGARCRWPSCTNRHYLHAHHLEHWADGGPTDAANLLLLCSVHHRFVHEAGWTIGGNANRPVMFRSPTGRTIGEDPPIPPGAHPADVARAHAGVHGDAITTAHGEPQDLDWTLTALCCLIPPERK